jgi:3-oxoacyl-[acyl-carrier protein] reductase
MLMKTRTALITGASRGIGKACSQLLAAAGYRLILVARSTEKLEALAAELRPTGVKCFVAAVDLSETESIQQAIPAVIKEAGNVDVLVNNAGVTKDGLSMRMKPADWEYVLRTNLSGTFYLTQQVLAGMMRERWGRIINISSVVGETGNPGQANYVASKAGLIGLTKTLAQELGSRNITVNAIAPGFIGTDMTEVLSQDLKDKMVERTPLRRMGTVEDIAHAVRFLASEEAGFITGHVLDVNGGIYM